MKNIFKIFSKEKQSVNNNVEVLELPNKNVIISNVDVNLHELNSIEKAYPKEVLEIHHEFSNAANNLLNQAKNIIAEAATKDISKVNRLESLGFKQANQVTELKPLIKKQELSKEQVKLVNHYQLNYPNNKFITEEQVQSICYKYNLVCGNVSRFKGFVPEKKLTEIENFTLKKGDEIDLSKSIYFIQKDGNTFWEITDITEKDILPVAINYLKKSWHFMSYAYPEAVNKYGNCKITSHFSQPELVKDFSSLKICAPIKDMDISGLTLSKGYKLNSHIDVPDPIVLQPVKGGFLILAAWGDEASDELVVNQKFN